MNYCLWVEYPFAKPVVFGPTALEDIRLRLEKDGFQRDETDSLNETYDKAYSIGRIKATVVPCRDVRDFPTGIKY